MKDEKMVEDGLKLILKGMGEETPQPAQGIPEQRNKPLNFRQSIVIASIMGVALMIMLWIVSYINIQNQNSAMLGVEKNKAQEFSDLVLLSIRRPMMTGDQDVVQVQFEQLPVLKDIVEVQLLDHAGIVKRATDRDLLNKKLDIFSYQKMIEDNVNAAIDGRAFCGLEPRRSGSGRVFTVLRPIQNEKACYGCHGNKMERLGVLRISTDLKSLEQAMQETQQQSRVLTVVSILLMSGLVFIVLKRYTQ